ncbi:hypothetical protein GGQ85_001676 [Nitrobacter vulgaris]|uniref:hypothetical protein n=1 Tax=Nitrobacter vulgaris TaxID=29421 RepID=UPI0028614294|nr:hypothetical protein [Nitrobacter vulgaris]MDR6303977.1 hypothetical protein [Nitrobacter vulgaris]
MRLSQARSVLSYSRPLAESVLSGAASLDDAHHQVQVATGKINNDTIRLRKLRDYRPDLAERRLADEYDAAQERGEVASGSVRTDIIPGQNDVRPATAAEVLGDGANKLLHEARLIRDAEVAEPGIVRRALDEKLAAGEEPTKAALRQTVQTFRDGCVVRSSGCLDALPKDGAGRSNLGVTFIAGDHGLQTDMPTDNSRHLDLPAVTQREIVAQGPIMVADCGG